MSIFSSPKPRVIQPAQAPTVENTTTEPTDTTMPGPDQSLINTSATGLSRKARTQKASLIGGM